MDVTYLHIPGFGWWYAVTAIDYYSRYLLACHLTNSYSAVEAIHALGLARQEAERLHGPLTKTPFLVTDNGSSFIAKRFWTYLQGRYSHVRIQYRTPTQLGLLERFHKTLKQEEVYWRLYDNPGHARECLEVVGSVTISGGRIGHWCRRPAAIPSCQSKCIRAGWRFAFRSGKAGRKERERSKLDRMLSGEAA